MKCAGLGYRLRANSFLTTGKSLSRDCPPPEVVKSGVLYLLTNVDTLLRVWTIVRDDKKLVCYDEPERSLLVASVSLENRYVLIGQGTAIEKETFFPIYIVEKNQLEGCFFAETLADQRDWLDAMTSAADLDHSLSLQGLNLECGKPKRPEKEKKKELNGSYFSENAPPLSALRDLEENNRQIALRRATLLKQRMISTELKVDGLKKLPPEPIYEIPANQLYYQTQLDELNIKLDNYTEAFQKYHEKRRQSISECIGRFTAERNGQHSDNPLEMAEGNKCKSALKMFGNFLDTKLRGHKRAKSADLKSHEVIDDIRPRSISSMSSNRKSSGEYELFQKSGEEKPLRTEIKESALHEIEAFEKFIKQYLKNHHEECFI